jgi:hypothetical protein
VIDTLEDLVTEIVNGHARSVASALVKQVVMHIGSDGRKNMRPIPLSDQKTSAHRAANVQQRNSRRHSL